MGKLHLVKLYRTVRETAEIAVEVDDDFGEQRLLWLTPEQRDQLENHAANVGSWDGDCPDGVRVVGFQAVETSTMPVLRLDTTKAE